MEWPVESQCTTRSSYTTPYFVGVSPSYYNRLKRKSVVELIPTTQFCPSPELGVGEIPLPGYSKESAPDVEQRWKAAIKALLGQMAVLLGTDIHTIMSYCY